MMIKFKREKKPKVKRALGLDGNWHFDTDGMITQLPIDARLDRPYRKRSAFSKMMDWFEVIQ